MRTCIYDAYRITANTYSSDELMANRGKFEAEANAQIAIAKAKGEAEAMKIKADTEAYYNRTISASLSEMIVREDFIEKWNGVLPTVQGGNGLIFDMSKFAK